ncbi:trypsin-like peptidase domain-containing protein [Kitasatospora sp. NPDC059827]|uniref:nSTAND1 domain-containing NTPase n=1 Tax=Kitasatospora sp. NPDC059827 TaxID=3346964 RepID=UPI003655D9BE
MTSPEPVAGGDPAALHAALLRVQDSRGEPVGVGFLVAEDLVLTCAHVVSTALGLPGGEMPPDGAQLVLDAALLPAMPEREPMSGTARVRVWGPAQPAAADVAVLALEAPLPSARPIRLIKTGPQQTWDHPSRVFGFPQGHPEGVWHSGTLRARLAGQWVQLDQSGQGHRVSAGFSGSAVWDEQLGGVVGLMTVAEAGTPPVSYLIPTDRLIAAWPDLGPLVEPPSPFRGLNAFQESDAGSYFGREADADQLAAITASERWTTLVGPSGCGKSSLAMAGVSPRRRKAGDSAVMVHFAAYNTALRALAAALLQELDPELSEVERPARVTELTEELATRGIRETAFRILELKKTSRLLVVLDQFEELLDQSDSAIDELADVLGGPGTPDQVAVLATLRADLLEHALAHPRLGPLVSRKVQALPPMRPDQLREVIAKPVDAVPGARYEDELIERILADAGSEPGILPLLGFTLDQLWRRCEGGLITYQEYTRLGGVAGALNYCAKEQWGALVPEADREVARRLLTRLVRIPVGTAAPLRRAVYRSEIDPQEWDIAQRLARARLLVIQGQDSSGRAGEGQRVEFAHEAVITAWETTRELVAADRSFLAWRESIQNDLDRWEDRNRPADLLPTRTAIALSRQWLPARSAELSEALKDYLKHGKRRLRRRRGALWSGVATICVLALVAAAAAVNAQRAHNDAARNSAITRANTLAADAAALTPTDPGLAAQLAIAAYRTSPTQAAASQLYTTLGTPLDDVLATTGGKVTSVAAQAHGPLVGAGTDDGSVRIWNTADPFAPVVHTTLNLQRATAIALAPDQPQLAASCPDQGGLCLLSLSDPQHPSTLAELPLPGPDQLPGALRVSSLAFSPDGNLLAAATTQGSSMLWSVQDTVNPRLLPVLPGNGNGTLRGGVAFAPTSKLLATTNQAGTTELWDLTDPAKPVSITAISTGYQSLAFSPDGSWLAAGGDAHVHLWKVGDTSKPLSVYPGVPEDVMSVAYSPDGNQLTFGGMGTYNAKSTLCHVDVSNISLDSLVVPACTSIAFDTRTLAATPNGAVLSGGGDGKVRLWRDPVARIGGLEVTGKDRFAISPDGNLIAAPVRTSAQGTTGGENSKIVGLWEVPESGTGRKDPLATISLAASSQTITFLTTTALLTVDHHGAVQFWDIHDLTHPTGTSLGTAHFPTTPTGLGDFIVFSGVSSSDDGSLVAVQGDAYLQLWRVTDSNTVLKAGKLPVPDPNRDLAGLVDNHTACVLTKDGTTWWDISDPQHPQHGADSPLAGANQGGVVASSGVVATTTRASGFGTDLYLYGLTAGHPTSTVKLSERSGSTVQFSDDSKLLAATGAAENTLTLWDTRNPAQPRSIAAINTQAGTRGLAFSPNSKLLAVWTSDEKSAVQLWDIRNPSTPNVTGTIPSGQYREDIRFMPNGARLAVVGSDSLRFFDTDPTALADRLCAYVGTGISTNDWTQYAPGIPYQPPCPSRR